MEKSNPKEKRYKKRDYVVFFIISFILIFLTSSFVIEDIYNSADNLSISPEGVKAVYETSIGANLFETPEDNSIQEDESNTSSETPSENTPTDNTVE